YLQCELPRCFSSHLYFFFNEPATTEIYTLSLHDALPIWDGRGFQGHHRLEGVGQAEDRLLEHRQPRITHAHDFYTGLFRIDGQTDRKSTRLNSSHLVISYAVFCLKKKNKTDDGAPDVREM